MCSACLMHFFFFFPPPPCLCANATLYIPLWAFRCPCLLMLFISSPLASGRPGSSASAAQHSTHSAGIKGEACGEAGSELRNVSVITGREVGGSGEGRRKRRGWLSGHRAAVLLGCLWSGFHHPVFDHLPGDDTAAEVRASGPGRSARGSNFRAGAFLNRYPRSYLQRCHVDYLTAFTDVTLGWLRSHFRVCARAAEDHPALTHWHSRGTTQRSHAARARGGARASRRGDCSRRAVNERVVSERNTDLKQIPVANRKGQHLAEATVLVLSSFFFCGSRLLFECLVFWRWIKGMF